MGQEGVDRTSSPSRFSHGPVTNASWTFFSSALFLVETKVKVVPEFTLLTFPSRVCMVVRNSIRALGGDDEAD